MRQIYASDVHHSLVTKLGTNVTNVNVLKRLMSLEITDLHHERMRTVVLSTDKQLGHDNRMIGSAAKGPNPPLGGSQSWGVDSKGLVIGVPSSGGLQTTNVGAVAQFRLSIASDDLVFGRTFQEELMLFGGTLFAQCHLNR